MTASLRILFLGASRLVGLLERFERAAAMESVSLAMLSVEDDAPWHAIGAASLARIVRGPRYLSTEFADFLDHVVATEGVDIVVPSIDSATVALGERAPALEAAGTLPVVSAAALCRAMRDKRASEAFFVEHGVRVPLGSELPLIAKPRFGSSSRGVTVLRDAEELAWWRKRHVEADYLVQPYVEGPEYTVDAYVAGTGAVLGAVSRLRVVVSGGEAMVTRTERNARVLAEAERVLDVPGWRGPITVQAIDDGSRAWVLECNPRFGSGTTCSIEAGLDGPRWILRERLGRELPTSRVAWKDGLCMTRSRRDHFLWS